MLTHRCAQAARQSIKRASHSSARRLAVHADAAEPSHSPAEEMMTVLSESLRSAAALVRVSVHVTPERYQQLLLARWEQEG